MPAEDEILASGDEELQQLLNWTKWTERLPGRPARVPSIDVLTAHEIITISPGAYLRLMLVIKR